MLLSVRPSAMCERSMPLRTSAMLKVMNMGISGMRIGRSWPDRYMTIWSVVKRCMKTSFIQ